MNERYQKNMLTKYNITYGARKKTQIAVLIPMADMEVLRSCFGESVCFLQPRGIERIRTHVLYKRKKIMYYYIYKQLFCFKHANLCSLHEGLDELIIEKT